MNSKTALPILFALIGTAIGCSGNPGGETGTTSDEALSAAQCATATAWAEWKAYSVGALVTFGGATYQCIQAHTSEPGWTPAAVPALWSAVSCAGGGGGSSGGGSDAGTTSSPDSGSSGGGGSTSTCNASAWVYMGSNANACDGNIGESCGWTSDNENQGYHCAATSWGTGCEPGGTTCPGGSGGGSSGGADSGTTTPPDSGTSGGGGGGGGGSTGTAGASLVFSPYKDTSINMNWNTNVISTSVSGAATGFAGDLVGAGGKTVTLAFATGECGSENWAGVGGAAMATANVSLLSSAGVKYIISTGGAAGIFSCGSDSGMATFINRWTSSGLIGVDFDIEAGQTASTISDLVARIKTAHGSFPGLRFSLTLATLANNNGASSAQSIGSGAPDSFNTYGDMVIAAVKSTLGFNGSPSSWPSYLTVDLMTMDYGSPSDGVCVVSGGLCEMGQSAIQAAYNLRDHWGVPMTNIELTPMIGGNDVSSEHFTLQDADAIASFAISNSMAGIHYWSYDRDTDSAQGSASATGNSMGSGYAGAHGFLKRFLADGLH